MSASLVADIEELHECSPLLQILRTLHVCLSCCRYKGSYMSAPLVADIKDLT